jgi:hypothetical protein
MPPGIREGHVLEAQLTPSLYKRLRLGLVCDLGRHVQVVEQPVEQRQRSHYVDV